MLPRAIRTSGNASRIKHAARGCSACVCDCGRPLNVVVTPNASAPIRRAHQTRRPAPSTIRKEARAKPRAKSVDEGSRSESQRQSALRAFSKGLQSLYSIKAILVKPQQAVAFFNDFEQLAEGAYNLPTVDTDAFTQLREAYQIENEDCLVIAQLMRRTLPPESFQHAWLHLFKALSRTEFVPATLWVMGSVFETARENRQIIHSKEFQYSFEHLKRVAKDENGDCRAKVLLGKVEGHLLGNEEKAIALYEQAIDGLEKSDAKKPASKRTILDTPGTVFQLDSPYIDLALLHSQRRKRGKSATDAAIKALELGCKHDDPWSHVNMARLSKITDAQSGNQTTSRWLYSMTKAAVSGDAMAMFELSTFYMESSWKYLQNEPPDHMKPTPFDSYPAVKPARLIGQIMHFLGFGQSSEEIKPEDDLFRSAAFPSSAPARLRLGSEWAKLAADQGVVAAYLSLANMHLQTTISSSTETPSLALGLSPRRYNYTSKEDYEAGRQLDTIVAPTQPQPDKEHPNPLFSRDKAEECLRDFFKAVSLLEPSQPKRQTSRTGHQTLTKNSQDAVQDPWRLVVGDGIQEQYKGNLNELKKRAEYMCDEHDIVIHDLENNIVYQPRLRN